VNFNWNKFLYFALAIVLFLAIPFLFGKYFVFVLSVICIFIVVSIGMNILTGYTGVLSLGHQAFFGIGAYTVAIVASRIEGFPFLIGLLMAGSLSGMIGYFMGFAALRTSGVYLTIATLALGIIMEEVFSEWISLTGGSAGMAVLPPALGSIRFDSSTELFYLISFITAIMFFFAVNLIASNIGRAFVAIRESEISAQSYGISLVKYKTLSFAISAFYTGVGGGLYAYLMKYVAPIDFNIHAGIQFVMAVIIGGLGSMLGSILGAIILLVLPQLFGGIVYWQQFFIGVVLLMIILLLPEGLSGGYYRLISWVRHRLQKRKECV
jgi:branched-chain amino acid transport system permease protein